MTSIGKIYSYPNNWRVARARAAAVLGGADIEEIWVTMDVVKSAEMLEKFPAGCVPVFEAKDGTRIHQSAAIATYAALAAPSGNLLSDDKATAARIAEWTAFADQEIAVPQSYLVAMVAGRLAYAKPTFTSVLAKVEQKLDFLNKNLEDKTYLVGDRITLADIFVASATFGAFTRHGQLDKAIRSKYNNVVRHMETVVKSPKLAEVFGEWEYVETAAQFQAPKKDAKPKAEKKADAPKAEKAPKAPKEKKPVEKDDDEEEPDVPAEPKQEHPCASLPPSSFNLENWKRVYSNSDSPEAMKYFVENLDREGYSVWRTDYKYNDELTQVFMSSNLIGGLFARLEGSRKYRESGLPSFGSMGVLGSANDSIISGVMVSRGKDIMATMDVAPDAGSYTYTQLDLENPQDKEFIEKSFDWTLEIDGKKWADGKNFK